MKVLKSHMATEIESLIKDSLDAKAIVFFDKSARIVMLKWVNIAISNAKRNFLGVYHKINGEYCKTFLMNLFTSSIEDILSPIFERLEVASVYPYWQTNE